MQQHRTIEVGDATLECTLCGVGAPVVLLANAGCRTGYFDHLARVLVTGGSRRSRLIGVASEAVAVLSTARPCTIWPVTSLASLRRSAVVRCTWSDMLSATGSSAVWQSISHRWFAA